MNPFLIGSIISFTIAYTLFAVRASVVILRQTMRGGDRDPLTAVILAAIWPLTILIAGIMAVMFDHAIGFKKVGEE